MPHSDEPLEARYDRQILLRQLGREGQAQLARGTACVVGCGALGSHQAQLLVRLGVGTVRIADRDVAERSNLHRQVLFDEDDVAAGTPKAEIAARKLRRANPSVTVEAHTMSVDATNVEPLIAGADVVLDATDNFETRYVLNDACVKHRIPWIYGGVLEMNGMCLVILPGETPCLRCLFPEPPPPGSVPSTSDIGIFPTLPALIAARQVTEAVKALTGRRDDLQRDLVQLDLWDNTFRTLRVRREPGCPACDRGEYTFLDGARR